MRFKYFWVVFLLWFMLSFISTAEGQYPPQVVNYYRGALVFAQDNNNTYLGEVSNKFRLDSIFNQFGTYGNPYSVKSIWNSYSIFGGSYSVYSPFNSYSAIPPVLVKNRQIIGYLTTNPYVKGGVSPYTLKAMEHQF